MNEEQALLAAVLDDYDDDLPRLALADFWEGNGQDERAEFIRVQCWLATPPSCEWVDVSRGLSCADYNVAVKPYRVITMCPSCKKTAALRHREGELLLGRGWDWAGYAVEQVGPMGASWHDHISFRRGFVAAVTCTAADWLEHGDAILAAQPVEEVTLTTWPAFRTEGRDYPMDRDAVLEELGERWDRVRRWHLPLVTGPITDTLIV